jgi:diguanylate cyclase (GGDEF)-like protein/PAS domain S-box-containing protein
VIPTPQILIVDDEPSTIKILSRTLEGMGNILVATSGAQAIAITSKHPVDLVLLDIIMPELDGYLTCRALLREHPELPVIFVTGASDPVSEIKALEVGGHDFISKPINPRVVRARIALHLKLQAQKAERQRSEETIQALNASLERRVADRTAALEAEIAERKRVEEALRISEERHRLLADHSLDVIWTMKLDGQLTYVSPSVEKVLGYTPEEYIRLPTNMVYQHASYILVLKAINCALAHVEAGLPYEFHAELEHLRKDGSTSWLEVKATTIYGNNEKFVEFFGVNRDITERKQVELDLRESERRFRELSASLEIQVEARIAEVRTTNAALKDSEERLRLFIDRAPAALAMFDCKMCYIALSRRWKDDYGLGARDIIGHSIYESFSGITEHWRSLHRRALAGETLRAEEDSFVCADGRVIWLRWEILPWYHQDHSVGGILIFSEDISEQKRARQEIEHLAFYDPLTDLPNRVLAQERLQYAVTSASRYHLSLAVLYFDMDKFKYINDTYGHSVGDLLLKGVAQRLSQYLRSGDLLSRLSGDEFMLVLPDVETVHIIPQVSVVCERLLASLAEPFDISLLQIHTSFSIGVAIYPQDGDDGETLMRNADTAMYEAKKSGPHAYRFFEPEMNTALIHFVQIRDALRLGLKRQEFELYYQPQIDLATGRVVGVEALIRWNRLGQGLTLPGTFIEAAEESGLIVAIGWWVLQEACRQAAAWYEMGWKDIVVAVNLSAVQFRQGQLGQDVLDALKESGLDPSRLELELTESILFEHETTVHDTITNWKAHGIQLSIDDFGTGYSNLAYLKRFKVDKLKIDRSFITNMEHDSDDHAIVQTIIQIAHSMKLRTIAEGVENTVMANRLKFIGCNEAQGYLYSAPLPAAAFKQWLTDYERHLQRT